MRFHSLLDQAMRAKPGLSASTPRPALSPQRVDQANVNEYENLAQARAWRGSTCSAASLTSVLRAHGLNTRIADVMKAMPGAITPELGLVSRQGLVRAAEHFGLKARDDVRTFDDLRRATASGTPVLVDVQNRQFPEGHWLVVKSATPTSVNVVDSSGYRLTSIPSDQFLRDWSGRGIRVNG
jgi:ABC-type bacteriocin/lantibiotic exporter with double-glycine peptidase domain